MKNLITRCMILVAVVLSPVFGEAADDTKSILMITWRGLTPAEEGFVEKLGELGIDADIDHFDANRDQTELAGFLRENLDVLKTRDLIYTFGTTVTQTVNNFDIANVPRVFNIVADPVGVGLVGSLDCPPPGMTGAKMSLSPGVNLELFRKIHPVQTMAILFDPRENNAVSEADHLTIAAEKLGITPKRLRFAPDADETDLQLSSLIPQLEGVDALYVTASSSFIAHSGILKEIIPDDLVSIGSSTAYIDEGITLAFGTEYRERGEAAAELAAKILLDDVQPNKLPIDEIDAADAILFVNADSKAASTLRLENATNTVVYK